MIKLEMNSSNVKIIAEAAKYESFSTVDVLVFDNGKGFPEQRPITISFFIDDTNEDALIALKNETTWAVEKILRELRRERR